MSIYFFYIFFYCPLNPIPNTSLEFVIIRKAVESIFFIIDLIFDRSFLPTAHIRTSFWVPVYIPFPWIPVTPLFTSFSIIFEISWLFSDIMNTSFVKYIPSNRISITFPIRYIVIIEYSPISIYFKNMTFSTTIIKSIIVIKFPVLKFGLYSFIMIPVSSEPPVDELALRIRAVPSPVKIPP